MKIIIRVPSIELKTWLQNITCFPPKKMRFVKTLWFKNGSVIIYYLKKITGKGHCALVSLLPAFTQTIHTGEKKKD